MNSLPTNSTNATRQEVYDFLQNNTTIFKESGRKILDHVNGKTNKVAQNFFQKLWGTYEKGPQLAIPSENETGEILGKTLRGVVVQKRDAWNAGWPKRSQSGDYFPDPGSEPLQRPNSPVSDATQKIYLKLKSQISKQVNQSPHFLLEDPRSNDL